MLLSDDDSVAFYFTTGKEGTGAQATNCRMDVFDMTNLELIFSKGERDVEPRQCRFPSFHRQLADANGTVVLILILTEYYDGSAGKAGLMRSYLGADYNESVAQDEERVFTGYDLVVTEAFYPSATQFYALAVNQVD